ncbi:cytochrome c oxidase assembly protein [Brevundimonas sp. SL161]|uniref:cytochrome c oxidase assembly protein n=1 Tax=Brevundimonas sp. SL161 TaxID=2804613 RepID=UPI003CF84052
MGPAGQAIPYCGPPPTSAELFAQWNLDPLILGPLLLGLAVVAVTARRLPASRIRAAGLALFTLAIAFVSPMCALSSALFAARTVHHILLICVAAPLIVLALPRPPRQGFPVVLIATVLQAAVLWFWHAPALYEAALSNHGVYAVMEITLLASAVLFWGAIRAATPPTAALALVLTMVQTGMLGALLVFAGSAVYGPHLLTTAAWGLTPLQDQQLAGLIMWAPAAGVYLATALVLVARWIGPDPAVVERQPA